MYSQYGEDEIIAKLLDERLGEGRPGRLLEIGAWDPKELSNSRLLIERGWDAVLVDFSPAPVRALLGEYGRKQNIMVLQAAVTTCDRGMRKFEITDDAVSSSDAAHLEQWKEKGGYFGSLWVPLLPIADLLNQFGGGYDFISVDAEGTSVELAIALFQAQQFPHVMCVEHDNRTIELQQHAQGYGYAARHTNGTNVILAR